MTEETEEKERQFWTMSLIYWAKDILFWQELLEKDIKAGAMTEVRVNGMKNAIDGFLYSADKIEEQERKENYNGMET